MTYILIGLLLVTISLDIYKVFAYNVESKRISSLEADIEDISNDVQDIGDFEIEADHILGNILMGWKEGREKWESEKYERLKEFGFSDEQIEYFRETDAKFIDCNRNLKDTDILVCHDPVAS